MKMFNLQGVIGQDVHAISLAAFLDALKSGEEATVIIDSVGGYVSEAFKMQESIDEAKARGVKVVTKAILVMSAANIVYLAADVRVAIEGLSKFLVHNCWSDVRGNASDLERAAIEQKAIDSKMRDYYELRSGKPASFFQKYMDSDSEFGADTAALLGFVTHTEKMKAMAMLSAPASKTDTDNVTSNLSNMNKEKTILDKIRGIFKAEGEQLPEDFPKETPMDAPVDAPADLATLMAKLDECMNRISAIESKLAGTTEEMDKCKETAEAATASVADVSASVLALAEAVAKASKGAIKATAIPRTDNVPVKQGSERFDQNEFFGKLKNQLEGQK